ncbi:GNAT family N-acetyltransferase [Paracoccus sp. M683]|uniref:GNAT family N-acetyltransferase n=1 Tax=Paracoccus sp. M683 TaxID=2594268 RepID=UPI00117DFCEB|nr:GNAT family N-acetyltransferase [Paracoccus sp. M683]TRW95918.1 GNAT family N-acetyltransferase [Paracoccus sp. M683]
MTQGDSGHSLHITDTTRGDSGIETAAGEVFALFLDREREFGVSPDVVIDHPDLAASDFLDDPAAYLARRVAAVALDRRTPIARVVILTTFADRIGAALVYAGYDLAMLDLGAGPDGTAALARELSSDGLVLYVEAVDEGDPKIAPTFALRLLDDAGRLCAGACGSVHAVAGGSGAWLAAMAVRPGMPQGTGTALVHAMIAHLRQAGVGQIDLGSQTADRFYEKLGFQRRHLLLPHLRWRRDAAGQEHWHDLVMMRLTLPEDAEG